MIPSTRAIAFRGVGYGTRQMAFRGYLAPTPAVAVNVPRGGRPARQRRRDRDDDVLIFLLNR